MPVPEEIRNRPRVDEKDPFLWKEKHTSGLKRTADDDSMRGVLIAVGVAVGIIVAFMTIIALVTVFWSFAEGRRSDAGSNIFLITGAGCFFIYLLVIGAAATGSVVRNIGHEKAERNQDETRDAQGPGPDDAHPPLGPQNRAAIDGDCQ